MQNEKYFSILIPSWNNLAYLQLCIESIHKNSSFSHQIIVHVNEVNDATLAWLKERNIEYTFSKENIGICKALNLASKKVETDYVVYLNDDMYVLPKWDFYLLEDIEKLQHKKFYLSATLLEPIDKNNSSVIAPVDFGTNIENFEEEKLLERYNSFSFEDWSGSSWPPSIVHKDIWNAVGGYSEAFSPGLYSDPDFSMKLWQLGVRYFKGISKARVYHFQSKSLGRVKHNEGRKQFYQKWGITAAFFDKYYLKKGQLFTSVFKEPSKLRIYLNTLKVKFYQLKLRK